MDEVFSLDGGGVARGAVPLAVARASQQWLAVHDAQTQTSARRLAGVVLACRLAAVAVSVVVSVVVAAAAVVSPEGSAGAGIGVFMLMFLLLSVVIVAPTLLFTALIKRSARLGREASAGRMRHLETSFPGYWSCDGWQRWHSNRVLAMRGPQS